MRQRYQELVTPWLRIQLRPRRSSGTTVGGRSRRSEKRAERIGPTRPQEVEALPRVNPWERTTTRLASARVGPHSLNGAEPVAQERVVCGFCPFVSFAIFVQGFS